VRVLWFTSVTPPAVTQHIGMVERPGPASWVESLRRILVDNHDVDLAIASPTPVPFVPFTAGGVVYYGMPVVARSTPVGRAASSWLGSFILPDMIRVCARIVRDSRPDVIHVHGTENPFGLIAEYSETPVLVSLQGLLTVYQEFYFHGMTPREITRVALTRDTLLGRGEIQGYWRSRRMADRERRIIRSNRFFAGRTEWDKAVLSLINPAASYYHCDEVLRAPFYKAEWQKDRADSRTVFCTSSTLLPKRAETLVEALALLRRAGHADLRLRIAGIPPQSPDSDFHSARARKHGVSLAIESLGRLDAEQLVSELLNASVFAYPSHIDNSPNALCEALLVGVPSVASYVGGVPSLVDDGRDGLLYPDGDAYALAGRIQRLLADPSEAASLARRARVRALRRHDPDMIATTLLDIYDDILPSAPAARSVRRTRPRDEQTD